MILNFNIAKNGKTYYEMNKNWRYIKQNIKKILDEKQSSKEYKIDMIIVILKNYKSVYLRSKGNNNDK